MQNHGPNAYANTVKTCLMQALMGRAKIACFTHLHQEDHYTITLWTGPFPVVKVSDYFFIITIFFRNSSI